MKKLLSLLCVLSLSAALLAGCSTAGDAGTSNAGFEQRAIRRDRDGRSDRRQCDGPEGSHRHGHGPIHERSGQRCCRGQQLSLYITAATDEVSAALAQGTTDIAAVPANLASVLYNNTEGGVQVLAINTLGVLYIVESGTRYTPWRISGARPFTPAAGKHAGGRPQLRADPERHRPPPLM